MNLFGHITEHYDSQWGFDPGSVPAHPPVVNQNSLPDELHTWNLWWTRDAQVLHLLVSCLSPSVRTQLPGTGSSQPQRCTAHSVYQELVRLFSGMDFNSAAVIRDELIALHCAPSHISDYISRWRSALNCLTSAGHLFDHTDSLWHFVKHLPFGSMFDIIRESVLFSLSTAHTAEQLPPFESIVEHIMNVDLNHTYFQPPCLHHIPSNTSSATPPTKDNTTTPTPPSTNHNSQVHPPHSTNFCTICCQTGHTSDAHKPGGGQEGVFMDQTKLSARAYIAEVNMASGADGGAVSLDQHSSPSPVVVDEMVTPPLAAFGTTPSVPHTLTSPVNNNVYFDSYRTGVIPMALSSITEPHPVCLSTVSSLYNSILDSGCMNHIIQDHSLFWTYHMSLATPVKTANCGILETLAKGDVKFHVQCSSQSVVLVLRDCLHAPSAPINLLSVGAMQERCLCIHFDENTTIIHFPSDYPVLSGLSIRVMRRPVHAERGERATRGLNRCVNHT